MNFRIYWFAAAGTAIGAAGTATNGNPFVAIAFAFVCGVFATLAFLDQYEVRMKGGQAVDLEEEDS